jgi:superfamily II DNA or RNA helicase
MPSSIIDNQTDNTLLIGLKNIAAGGRELCIATAFFSLDALLLIADALPEYERIRILFGDDADAKQRARLLEMLRSRSDEDLLAQRESLPQLSPLRKVEALFTSGKVEARCYTSKKFHAKAYLVCRSVHPPTLGILGSGNFTRAGLTQNIELNVELTIDQTSQLADWFEERWDEASADVVTEDVLAEIRRQIELYEPYVLYLKALFLWAQQQQDESAILGANLASTLDPHQEQGFRQALRILDRQNGVMVCDGVGLGKSFVALALMDRFCREGKNVLLLAPKSILVSSWEGYLDTYLTRYRAPFGSIFEMPMTALGFDADEESDSETIQRKTEELQRLAERADVIVLDESHNFRSTPTARYKNLFQIAQALNGKRKKVVLLTATPINTAYRDLSSQIALITQDTGSIAGYSIEQIRRAANELDRASSPVPPPTSGQLVFQMEGTRNDDLLLRVLENLVIQRSRATCKQLAKAKDKELRFPIRHDPECIEYQFGDQNRAFRDLIKLTDAKFRPGVNLFQRLQETLKQAETTGKEVDPDKIEKLLQAARRGIKLAAFLTEQYRRVPVVGSKVYRDEVHLAGLVFSNTLKQLESSPPAFQGIVQSLGIGLIARLKQALGDEADTYIAPHRDWVREPLFEKETVESDALPGEVNPDIEDDGDTLDASGAETDDWLNQAVRQRGLTKKLKGFNREAFDVDRWREDIVSDLRFLKEIHDATLTTRQQPDPKLLKVVELLQAEVGDGNRVLVFTQSQRTATYLERAFKRLMPKAGIARIDSRVEQTRAAILYAFCPGYNPPAFAPSVPDRVDVLISTDVLAEGVNLQEAGAILNYDIHWNPVRLIQRIGRVDRRLNPAITPNAHSFSIYNVLPPPEIETIIGLVGAVENRTLKISRTLGLDVSFFKDSDPAGNLREFNSQYEGTISDADAALTEYVRLTTVEPPDEKTQRLLKAIPPGAFGVWKGAPENGLFALFTMESTKRATESDRVRFASVLGRPVLALAMQGGRTVFDAGKILTILSKTTPGEESGMPSDEDELARQLRALRNGVRDQFRSISLPQTILPSLVCWMELRA